MNNRAKFYDDVSDEDEPPLPRAKSPPHNPPLLLKREPQAINLMEVINDPYASASHLTTAS
jgi:hypothetical protein